VPDLFLTLGWMKICPISHPLGLLPSPRNPRINQRASGCSPPRDAQRLLRTLRYLIHIALCLCYLLTLLQRIILKNPFVPLVFRLIVLTFTVAALGLGARVFHEANAVNRSGEGPCSKRASTYMAIILDSAAVPYIGYITWDEYLSKP
jgi:hypothetical protein